MSGVKVDAVCLHESLTALGYVALWISLSAGVILYNKWVLFYFGFPYPITLTMMHMAFATAASSFLLHVLKLFKPVEMTREQYVRGVVPIGALFAGSLWLGNSAYLYISVSFIQMLKAFMPVAVYTVGIFMRLEQWSYSRLCNMLVITVGVMYAANGEVNFVLVGFCLQMASIFTESVRLAFVQILLTSKGLGLNALTTLYYISPVTFAALSVPWLFMEAPTLLDPEATIPVNWLVFLSNCSCALLLNLAVFMLIGKTSALSMNVAGVFKDWLLIGLSALLFEAPVSAQSIAGYVVAFVGVMYYNYSKLTEKAAAANRPASPSPASPPARGDVEANERAPLMSK